MAITLMMYAQRKQWPLEDVSVDLTHDKVLTRDCAECTDEEVARGPTWRIDRPHRRRQRGDLTPEQRDRLLEIAGRCPVHRTLEAPPKIVTAHIAGRLHDDESDEARGFIRREPAGSPVRGERSRTVPFVISRVASLVRGRAEC